ncbi:MAG: GNAT family N-acetyltransferase [Terracidiphilus sp.]
MDIRFREMTGEDIPRAIELKDAAGWNQTAADWRRFLSASPEVCIAAERDGQVIGTSACMVYENRFAWIGMVIVDARHRGKGIGTALLEKAVQYLDARGIECAKLDATPQGKIVYGKLGFVSEYEIERWALNRDPQAKTTACTPTEIEDLLVFDRDIYGADRAALLCSMHEAAPEFTRIARRGEEIDGYAFGRHGSLADHLGPWVARSRDTAEKLLVDFLRHSSRERVFVDCVARNSWAIPVLRNHGFQFSRPLARMYRGKNLFAERCERLGAIVGPEFG